MDKILEAGLNPSTTLSLPLQLVEEIVVKPTTGSVENPNAVFGGRGAVDDSQNRRHPLIPIPADLARTPMVR